MNNYRSGFGYQWRLDAASYVTLAATGIIMAFSVVTLTPTPSLGEERGRERPTRQQVLDKLASLLRLSEQQKSAVAPIFDEEAAKRREFMDKLRLEMDRLDRETTERLAKVLSAEQMAQYDKLLAERRNRGGERHLPPPGQEETQLPLREGFLSPPHEGAQPRLPQ